MSVIKCRKSFYEVNSIFNLVLTTFVSVVVVINVSLTKGVSLIIEKNLIGICFRANNVAYNMQNAVDFYFIYFKRLKAFNHSLGLVPPASMTFNCWPE